MSIKKLVLMLVISIFSYSTTWADELALNPDHPDRYIVVKGDTLWDISTKFLRDAWRWPEIWHNNPDIANPHLIYPGDVIALTYHNGKPVLTVQRRARPTVKLAPKAHATRIESAIPAVPAAAVGHFLSHPRVMSEEEIQNSGYILAAEDERLVSASNTKVYVRGLPASDAKDYSILHIGREYRHPETNDILGYEAKHVSDAQLVREGDPATLRITQAYRETLIGDRVIVTDNDGTQRNFTPHAPEGETNGKIITIFDGVANAGLYQSVVINVGKDDGLEQGHVLAIRQKGSEIRDHSAKTRSDRWVDLPDERAALVMLYRVFDNVSYALVMKAEKDIRAGDLVTNP